MNFKIIRVFPNMTKSEKLRVCEKCNFFSLEDFIAAVDAIS